MNLGRGREAESQTLVWVLSRQTWRGHSDFRPWPTSSKKTRWERGLWLCRWSAKGVGVKKKGVWEGFLCRPPSSKWPAAAPFYYGNLGPHVSNTRVLQGMNEREIFLSRPHPTWCRLFRMWCYKTSPPMQYYTACLVISRSFHAYIEAYMTIQYIYL